MKKRVFGLFVFWAIPAAAFDASVSGTQVTVSYAEPTKDLDGSPLEDLLQTEVYYQVEGSTVAVLGKGIAASKPQGGGGVQTNITIPVAQGEEKTVQVFGAARDTSGNISQATSKVPVRIDRMPPAPPQ